MSTWDQSCASASLAIVCAALPKLPAISTSPAAWSSAASGSISNRAISLYAPSCVVGLKISNIVGISVEPFTRTARSHSGASSGAVSSTVREAAGNGYSRKLAATITPNVPSEPVNSLWRS